MCTVLTAAGLHVVDLDQELGATKSADLLVSLTAAGTPRQLVEIKGAGGGASERLVRDLQRHLETWPQLRPEQPVAGGVLIVNHQHKLDPSERNREVHGRTEFVDALQITVLSARPGMRKERDRRPSIYAAAVVAPADHRLSTGSARVRAGQHKV